MSPSSEGRRQLRARCQAWCWRPHPSQKTTKSPLAKDPAPRRMHPGVELSGTCTRSSGSHLDTCVSLTCSLSRPGKGAAVLSKFAIRLRRPGSPPTLTHPGCGRRLRAGGRDRGWESPGLQVWWPRGGLLPCTRSDQLPRDCGRTRVPAGRRCAPPPGCCSEALGRPLLDHLASLAPHNPNLAQRQPCRLQPSPVFTKKHHLSSVLYALFQRILPIRLGNVQLFS